MRNPSTSTRELPLLTATRKSPHGKEDPVQPKINKLKKKDCHACGTSGPHENCAHLCASLGALRCIPVSARCLPPQGAGVGLSWHLGSGADHEDAETNEDHAGGHSTDEDLEGHHHLLRLPAGS